MVLKQEGDFSNAVFSAIQFNVDPAQLKPAYFEHILYRLKFNRWNGKKSIQMVIEDT
jgi:single-stranded-DNA-specific exonuclease